MTRKRTLLLLLAACFCSASAMAQIDCAAGQPAADKLVCQIPFSTGVFSNSGSSTATAAALRNATAFNSAIATQVSQLPLSSSSSGVIIVYKNGIPETFNNLGPIMTDRAQTIGRHQLYVGVTASQYVFTDIDGINLKNLPFTFQATAQTSNGRILSNIFTTESTNIKFTLDQLAMVGTFGLTSRIDFSVIVPYERVSIGAATYNSSQYILNANNQLVLGPLSIPSTYVPGNAHGIGDITFNGKGELWHGERSTVSAGLNLRAPTGDELNYLGSGAWGISPYVIYSYLAKVAPHAKVGYQWNTSTELDNPTLAPGGNQNLPGGFRYDVGADWAVARRVTLAGDILGSQFLNAPTLHLGTTPLPVPSTNPPTPSTISLPTVTSEVSSYTVNDVSGGLKWNPFNGLVLSGNAMYQINNNGLRSRVVPMVGVSYKF